MRFGAARETAALRRRRARIEALASAVCLAAATLAVLALAFLPRAGG